MNTRCYTYHKSEFLDAHRDYIEKFQFIELSQELTIIRTHLIRLFFSSIVLNICGKHSSSLIICLNFSGLHKAKKR
ncbi:unnamed protein product, partial [Rotaria sordida]